MPSARRRRLSDDSRRDDVGREESSRKRKRRILSCDTCRRQKCRCELDEESEAITCTWNDSGDTHSVSSREAPAKLDVEGSNTYELVAGRNADQPFNGRFRSLEASIVDLKATIQELATGSRPATNRTLPTGRQERRYQSQQQPSLAEKNVVDEHESDKARGNDDVEPADRHVYLSPAEVVRKVGSQLSGGYRRTFDVQADVVSSGILDEKTARDLVAEFVRRRRHTLLINSEIDLAPKNRDLRHASPFLHDACCLHAMRFSEHSSSVLHRRVFEHVRLQMGQLMIVSPLPLEELTGIMIMGLWASAPSGPEYIDSWLVSGHCAQQAMLSINFSEVLSRTKSRTSTEEDQRVMRLWANTCLINLHWAATTSRPATVPAAYLQQCKLLLNFEEVTMRDAMVYAEIMLYLILQDKFAQRSYLRSNGACEELSAWKARWNYLFDLPAASTLRISYSIAWLILARRSLEHDQATSDQDSLSSSPRLAQADAPAGTTNRNADYQGPPDMTQSRVRAFATNVVRAFVDMPGSRAEELPEFHRLCVAYAMLIISKYEHKTSLLGGDGDGDGDDAVLELLRAAQRHNGVRGNSAPSAIQFGLERALKKVAERAEAHAGGLARAAAGGDGHGLPDVELSFTRSGHTRGPPAVAAGAAATASATWTHHQQDTVPGQHENHPSSFTGTTLGPEFDESLSLETMDIFFSGGHLGLGDHSFF
ncbi:hypothetical protein CORC01_03577 [Colletotrichum orchidophilum]|uniref:Zn(2)-C6 fungal-type domain-containing protein n=1 Tax=Colletotrichum orchidophilum TaxID=1209926 RepID=A0A1G4BHK9_9PEZI|nr:uncharacterized protein CORC01_03577 [Colletotrichum orchidophilum]OHF01010.1 hypothetical protein CORC01_03577 [Colletotrichum orchidophilum]